MEPPPLPPLELRHYGQDDAFYELGGRNEVGKIEEITGRPIDSWGRILDFGCAEGRLLRHLPNEAWGLDVRPEPIAWMKAHLPHPGRYHVCGFNPPTGFPRGYFDLILAHSVFTHLHRTTVPWLLELRRLLSWDGILIVTIQDRHCVRMLGTREDSDAYASWYPAFCQRHPDPRLRNAEFDVMAFGGGLALEGVTGDATPYESELTVFHSRGYFLSLAAKYFRVKRYKPEYYHYQAGVTLGRHRFAT